MGEVTDGMRALGGKLNHLDMDCSPAKSTARDGLRKRTNELYRDFYFELMKHFESVLSVSQIKGISFDNFYLFDSTTIRLFSDIIKGVGCNPLHDGKKKGGLKVHMLTDGHSDTAKFATISEAKMYDKNFLDQLHLPVHTMIVLDRACVYYEQFALWSSQKVNFVCHLKKTTEEPTIKGSE